MASTKEPTTLNEAQTNFLALLMRNINSKPDIDFEAVAKELGINEKSAKERFRLLSIKMGWKDAPNTPKKPTGVTKRTPAKLGSGKKGGRGKVATPDNRGDSDEEVKKMDDSGELVKDEGEA